MAAPFYTRYIPPRNSLLPKPPEDLLSPAGSEKRKRKSAPVDDAAIPPSTPSKKARKRERNEKPEASVALAQSQKGTFKRGDADSNSYSKAESDISPLAVPVQIKDNSPEGRKQKKGSRKDSHEISGSHSTADGSTDSVSVPRQRGDIIQGTEPSDRKGFKKRKLDRADDASTKAVPVKHAGILSKFEKSRLTAASVATKKDDSNTVESLGSEDITPHGLEPLPQPAPAPAHIEAPTYSTLPSWLSQPFAATTLLQRDFANLGLNKNLISILQKRGYTKAFPIQAAVLELLGNGEHQHSGDLCISAATGSGKTLAYALPLVAGIEQLPLPRLRGLVVVPTRELVKQARDACELCATGTGLRIGTAVGTASLKEEQTLLIKHDQLYSPSTSRIENSHQMIAESWASFNFQEYITEAERSHSAFPNHVVTPSPNIDILICTPGRLVDHIRSTKGFRLEHLEWLVIDEADRLLNESFQEWVEVVIPALERDRVDVAGKSGRILHDLGWQIYKPQLQKIILSATMTRDIAKLNSLRLQNPKLVVSDTPRISDAVPLPSEGNGDISTHKDDHAFNLPSTLREAFVPVGDAADKPLYLLTLLLSHFKLDGGHVTNLRRQRSHSITSDSSSTSPSSSLSGNSSSDESSAVSYSSSDTGSSDESSIHGDNYKPIVASTPSVLVFTKSSESASRLARLLALLHPPFANRIGTLTKSSKSSTSRKTISAYRNGKLSIVIATDRASRGLDLPSLTHVVSYDIPTSLTSYIHRVGRTARAGRSGSAWTLVAHREGRWFANEIVKCPETTVARTGNVEKITIKLDEGVDLKTKYSDALRLLQAEVAEDRTKYHKPGKPRG
ncbi:hypothetical protein EMPG_12029 [Blastomyces silverae]|uniref:ATP-dependent RNA helicase n=1 Tax=Blastomyces silverae TaxID=2060906 RepID=A0A0H1BPR1_9EURO|nr:hypothetical protein EMPG_12029 [Blastomyces silverae]